MTRVEDYIGTAEIKATTLYSSMGQSYRFHDIQDLTQELLVVAWLAIATYDAAKEASMKTWVNRKMDYFIQDFVREEKNRKIHIDYVGDLWDLYAFAEKYKGAHTIVLGQKLDEVFELLNDKQKEILKLKIEGYTHEEIAEQLGYSDNSGVAHQWKQIADIIVAVKNDKGDEVVKNPQERYFQEFWKNLPQNKGFFSSEEPEIE